MGASPAGSCQGASSRVGFPRGDIGFLNRIGRAVTGLAGNQEGQQEQNQQIKSPVEESGMKKVCRPWFVHGINFTLTNDFL